VVSRTLPVHARLWLGVSGGGGGVRRRVSSVHPGMRSIFSPCSPPPVLHRRPPVASGLRSAGTCTALRDPFPMEGKGGASLFPQGGGYEPAVYVRRGGGFPRGASALSQWGAGRAEAIVLQTAPRANTWPAPPATCAHSARACTNGKDHAWARPVSAWLKRRVVRSARV
jgi:hypothetical protein